jgi:hypothetical protein
MFRFLDRPVCRPDLWGLNLGCSNCGWHTGPDGPWTIRNCLFWPQRCPQCHSPLHMLVPDCPHCQTNPLTTFDGRDVAGIDKVQVMLRIPQSWRGGLWGHHLCPRCGREYDKWGRPVSSAG